MSEQGNSFYVKNPDQALRFGDVLGGFVLSSPDLERPNEREHFKLDVRLPQYVVVLSPCCSIGDKTITLCPMKQVMRNFFRNPFFAEDLTRINRIMDPQKAFAPDDWEKIKPEEQRRIIDRGIQYALTELFIYEPAPPLPVYELKSKKWGGMGTGNYMIDFKDICRVGCSSVNGPKQAPVESRILQLTVQSRRDLRNKIGYYFNRTAPEDAVLLGD